MLKLPDQGPFTVQLRNGAVVSGVYRTKDQSDYYYAAYNEPPTDEDLERSWRSPKLKRERDGFTTYHYAWYALGSYHAGECDERDIVGVVTEVPASAKTIQSLEGTYIIAIDVRDSQLLMFGLANIAISKQIDPLIKQLENQYHINASSDHDGTMQDKLIENVRKLKSADMVIRFDGHWWPVRFVKTVNSFQEGLESI